MSAEAKKNVVRRYIDDLINSGRWDRAGAILSANFVLHHSSSPDPIVGRDAFCRFAKKFRTSFPDLHATIEDIFTDEDTVIVRVVWSGTHLSHFDNIPPTQRAFALAGTGIYRVKEGLLVEAWAEYDPLELLSQIAGLGPEHDIPEA